MINTCPDHVFLCTIQEVLRIFKSLDAGQNFSIRVFTSYAYLKVWNDTPSMIREQPTLNRLNNDSKRILKHDSQEQQQFRNLRF